MKIYHFYQKKQNKKSKKACLWFRRQKEICYSHKSFKIITKSWFKTKKCTQSIYFNQKSWLRLYIEMNTKLRKEAKNELEKDLWS